MSFKKNQLVSMPTPFPGYESYVYKNCSIAKSSDSGHLTISIVSHYGPGLPKSETEALLSALGMNLSKPIEKSIFKHNGVKGMSDSIYYRQEVA